MAVRTQVRFKIYQYVIAHEHTILSRDHSARDLGRPSWLFDAELESRRFDGKFILAYR